ncbi:PHO85 cyclin-5 [Microdochium nivale]|nr:PHO85 cyclin-5 [Microdochium nivale]
MYQATAHQSLYPYSPPSTYPTAHPRGTAFLPFLDQSRQKPAPSLYSNRQLPHPTAGLRTPPGDNKMNATYANPVLSNSYDNHVSLARQPHGLTPMGRTGRAVDEPIVTHSHYLGVNPHQQLPQHQQQQFQQQQVYSHSSQPPAQHQQQPALTFSQRAQPEPVSRQQAPESQLLPPKAKSVVPENVTAGRWEGTVSKKESKMVTHCLDLPRCISPNGGRLDEFAAMMTCFFWFETMDTIRTAEHIKEHRPAEPLPRLSQYTEPCPAYKKWVHGILTTTQVTQNVVLLALLFVYRLKKTNPKVNGNPGSEYRLLTVALMLGNKFLDDNTYTNKTWAEVSGISVREIHVMEVEFLSNMRYGLLTSKDQWQDWLSKLACFHDYCETAKVDEVRRQSASVAAVLSAVSPSNSRFSSPLPSPTSILPSSMSGAPASLNAFSSATPIPVAHNWPASYHATPSVTPHATKPSQGMARKRSLDGTSDSYEPAAKRMPRQASVTSMPVSQPRMPTSDAVRLPVPQLSVDTTQNFMHQQPAPSVPQASYPPQQHAVSLPPLGQGVRAMATVFPTSIAPVSTWAPQPSIMAPSGPQTPTGIAASHFGTPSKRHSPGSISHFASSPLADPYAALTPISNSPSIYLQQRASPYKPIRRVNTLLYPPPSMPLSEYHLGSTQMHYQPLGRRNDLRTGIVPEFLGSGQMQMRFLTHTPGHQHQQHQLQQQQQQQQHQQQQYQQHH